MKVDNCHACHAQGIDPRNIAVCPCCMGWGAVQVADDGTTSPVPRLAKNYDARAAQALRAWLKVRDDEQWRRQASRIVYADNQSRVMAIDTADADA